MPTSRVSTGDTEPPGFQWYLQTFPRPEKWRITMYWSLTFGQLKIDLSHKEIRCRGVVAPTWAHLVMSSNTSQILLLKASLNFIAMIVTCYVFDFGKAVMTTLSGGVLEILRWRTSLGSSRKTQETDLIRSQFIHHDSGKLIWKAVALLG